MALELHWLDHILAVILLIFIPMMSLRSGQMTEDHREVLPPKIHLYYSNGLLLIISASLVYTTWNVWQKPWQVLGIYSPTFTSDVIKLVALVCIIYIGDLVYNYWQQQLSGNKDLESIADIIPANLAEYRHYTFLAVSAGVCEEIIYRGFLFNYVYTIMGNVPYAHVWAMLIPSISFGISHLYQGWIAVSKILIIAILLSAIFYYSSSLWIVIIIHIAIDLLSGYIGMLSLRDKKINS
jgi:uncharacterized protein